MNHFTNEYHKFFTGLAKNNNKAWFDKHKRIPPDFSETAEKQPLLANKDFYVLANLDSAFIINDNLPEILMTYYFAVKPPLVFFTNAMR